MLSDAGLIAAITTQGMFVQKGLLDYAPDFDRGLQFHEAGAQAGLWIMETQKAFDGTEETENAIAYFSESALDKEFDKKTLARHVQKAVKLYDRFHELVTTEIRLLEKTGGKHLSGDKSLADQVLKDHRHRIVLSAKSMFSIYKRDETNLSHDERMKGKHIAWKRVVESGSTHEEDQEWIRTAMYDIGCILMQGYEGVPSNPKAANAWWRKAADLGHPMACNNLGSSFYLGNGLPKDEEKAHFWYRKAKENGFFTKTETFGNELHGWAEAAIAKDTGVPEELAKWVLQGNDLKSRMHTFRVNDWLVANGKASGPRRVAGKLAKLVLKAWGGALDAKSAADVKAIIKKHETVSSIQKGIAQDCPEDRDMSPLDEIRWILGKLKLNPKPESQSEETSLAPQTILHLAHRFIRLADNIELVGGHLKPLSAADVDKNPLFAKLVCVTCGKTAQQTGTDKLKRCTACKSVAMAYCGRECQTKDYSGELGVHGVKSARRVGRESECGMIGKALSSK